MYVMFPLIFFDKSTQLFYATCDNPHITRRQETPMARVTEGCAHRAQDIRNELLKRAEKPAPKATPKAETDTANLNKSSYSLAPQKRLTEVR
jgi:hypothetical protein